MNKEHILSTLREHKPILQKKYGVIEIGLFGSFAVDEAEEKSDVDLVVTLKPDSKRLHNFLELERYLTTSLGIEVDLGIKENVHPVLKNSIEKDLIYV